MSKLKPLYVLIPGVLLVAIVICVFMFVLIPPVKEEIDTLEGQVQEQRSKAEEKPRVEERLAQARVKLAEQQAQLDVYMATRGIRVSTYTPPVSMVSYWYELQEDLAPTIETFLESTGCQIVQGAALPAPGIELPALGPGSFFPIPPMTFTLRGTEQQLRDLYAGLSEFERVATISGLSISPVGNGEKLEVTFQLSVYLLAEGPEAAAGGGGAAGGMGGMPGMPGAPGGDMGMGMPGAPGAGMSAMGPGGDGGEDSGDDADEDEDE